MRIEVLYAKIKSAKVTRADFDYNKGSITLDPDFADACGMYEWQRVDINNKTTGGRYNTYILLGKRGSKCLEANGALARLISVGDEIHINAYGSIPIIDVPTHKPKFLDKTY